ncbi:hypothetical protein BT67DRAFT_126266 [Trichocladium antarcticum]|uniref:2EXR domain-containing protein n=1 Tax=Trichocladium antarcticum TaxID=1450529 RepID=A0AAN6URM5_9PEZI|nr:hypothetical protein BT67DRAFT_126266 [Trichocladium antarcticum]
MPMTEPTGNRARLELLSVQSHPGHTSTVHSQHAMLDPDFGTMSSWIPGLGRSGNATTSPQEANDNDPYWLILLVKFALLCTCFSDSLQRCVLLGTEFLLEAHQNYRLRSSRAASASLPTSSPYRPQPRGTPRAFPHFRLLPLELREMIWTEALPGPRLLLLAVPDTPSEADAAAAIRKHRHHRGVRGVPPLPDTVHYIFHCAARPPALLAVCAEARAVARRSYRLAFAPAGCPELARVYADLDRDVVGLSDVVMESSEGRNLFRAAAPDMAAARHFCVASGVVGEQFLARRPVRKALAGVVDVAVVESGLLRAGTVPWVARVDWAYWVRWRARRGELGWRRGGEQLAGWTWRPRRVRFGLRWRLMGGQWRLCMLW